MQSLMNSLHDRFIFQRRARILSTFLAELVPAGSTVLDVGCGNGVIGHLVKQMKPTVLIQGLEVTPRPSCLIECTFFNGAIIPMRDASVDVCMFVDVLHHTLNIEELLKEARRVARHYVLIKDHLCESKFDNLVLSVMDWAGKLAHGVRLKYNYQSRAQWDELFRSSGLKIVSWNEEVPLYPPPFDRLFGCGLHFVGLCENC